MVAYSGPSQSQGGVIARPEAQAYTPEIWNPQLRRYRNRAFSMAQYVTLKNFPKKKGDLIREPYLGRLKSRRKVAGQPYQFETRKEGEFRMVVDRQSYAAFAVDFKVNMFAEIDIAAAYSPELGQALTEEIEYSLLGERATAISYDPISNHHTTGGRLSATDLDLAVEEMMLRNFNIGELMAFVGPSQYMALFQDDVLTNPLTSNAGDLADIKSGTIMGTYMNMPIILNQNIRRNATDGVALGGQDYPENLPYGGADDESIEFTATPGMAGSKFNPTQWGSDKYPITLDDFLPANGHSAVIMHSSAIALAMPKTPSLEIWWNPEYGDTRFKSEQIYDIKTVDPTSMFIITSDEDGDYVPA